MHHPCYPLPHADGAEALEHHQNDVHQTKVVVVSKSKVIIFVLLAVIVVVIVVIVVVLIIDIVVIIIIVEITPPMPGTHLTMRLVVAFWLLLLYDMINLPPIVLSILF